MKRMFICGALCAMCTNFAFAKEASMRPYIGGSINYNFVSFSSEAEETMDWLGLDLADGYFGVGLEGGIRFGGTKDIWNGGLSFAYDYTFDTDAGVYNMYIDEVKTGFSAWNIGFDNYIRVNEENDKRYDLVLGLGFGQATERVHISGSGITEDYSGDGGVFVLKFGTNIQLSEQFDWYTTIRGFIPTKTGDVEHIISVQTGIKFNF